MLALSLFLVGPSALIGHPAGAPAAAEEDAEPAEPVTVTRVRVGRHCHYTRIVLDASGAMPFEADLSADRRQVRIVLGPEVRWDAATDRTVPEAAFLARITVQPHGADGPTLIVDGNRPLLVRRTLSLPPDQHTAHHRYVLDLAPDDAPDPTAAVHPAETRSETVAVAEPGETAGPAGPAGIPVSRTGATARTGAGIRVTGVRIGRHPAKARLVLDAAGETGFRPVLAESGRSVRIPLPRVDWQAEPSGSIPEIPFLTGYRFEPDGTGTAAGGRFVVEADRPVQILTALVLAPGDGSDAYRYVLDLAPLPVPADRAAQAAKPPPKRSARPSPPAGDPAQPPDTGAAPASPESSPPSDGAAWTPPDPETAFSSVETYMRGLETLQARFIQVVDETYRIGGTFYLHRPGRMRLEYDPPVGDFFVADGWFLFFWDDDLGQQSSTPIGSTLADFILRENFSLSDDVTVTRLRLAPGRIAVTVVQRDDPAAGTLTMTFADNPVRLLQWTVRDNSGTRTRVVLSEVRTGMALDEDLFYFKRPREREPHDK